MASKSTIASIDTSTDVLTTSAAHGLTAGDAVGLHVGKHLGKAGTMPTASITLTDNSTLFAGTITSTTFKLYRSKATAIAETSAIDITAAGLGTLYVTRLTIKERIERRLVDIIEADGEIASCQRVERRGNSLSVGTKDTPAIDALLVLSTGEPADADAANSDNAGDGITIKSATYQLLVVIYQADDDLEPTSAIYNRWLGNLETLVTADPTIAEASPSDERLAVDVSVSSTLDIELEQGQREVTPAIEFDVEYQHRRNNPYSLTW